jgi:hypothetical protein
MDVAPGAGPGAFVTGALDEVTPFDAHEPTQELLTADIAQHVAVAEFRSFGSGDPIRRLHAPALLACAMIAAFWRRRHRADHGDRPRPAWRREAPWL